MIFKILCFKSACKHLRPVSKTELSCNVNKLFPLLRGSFALDSAHEIKFDIDKY